MYFDLMTALRPVNHRVCTEYLKIIAIVENHADIISSIIRNKCMMLICWQLEVALFKFKFKQFSSKGEFQILKNSVIKA